MIDYNTHVPCEDLRGLAKTRGVAPSPEREVGRTAEAVSY